VRTPAVDAPVATLSGLGNTGANPVCFLLGTTTPFDAARLAALYPLHSDYVAAVRTSTAAAVRRGFVLPADGFAIDSAAAGSTVAMPATGWPRDRARGPAVPPGVSADSR
jgi:hypothetical protein